MLTLLIAADSFDDLLSNSHYIEKDNDADKQVIGELQTIRADLEQHKSTLESQKADLEALKEQQAQQLSVMQAKQAEVQQLVDGLSSDVRDLIACLLYTSESADGGAGSAASVTSVIAMRPCGP